MESVAVVGRVDAIVLRHALTVRSVSDEVPLLLTIFDPTMAEQMQDRLGHTRVTSLADIVAPSLAGPCVDERFTAVTERNGRTVGLVEHDGEVREVRSRAPSPAARRLSPEPCSPPISASPMGAWSGPSSTRWPAPAPEGHAAGSAPL